MPSANCWVLVVEDELAIREPLVEWLEAQGLSAVAAVEGWHALRLIERYDPPALILLDLDMPGMNGRELLEKLRHHALLRLIPVIVLSSNPPEHDAPEPVLTWLRKPYSPEQLLSQIRFVLASVA